jgi:hypothetical protein
MKRDEMIWDAAVDAAINDTAKGRNRDGYMLTALADHELGFEDGFKEGANWADQHPHWISVKDELPKEPVDVLVYDEDDGILVSRYMKDYWSCADDYLSCDCITHWMPLPKIPE